MRSWLDPGLRGAQPRLRVLCVQVAEDLQRRRYVGRTIGIKLRFDDFRTVTRDLTLPQPTADALAIQKAARTCLKRVQLDRRLRLLGVRVSSLSTEDADGAAQSPPPAGETLPLFPGAEELR